MALGDPYATVVDLEARIGQPDDGTYADLLAAASRHVEWFTGRQFNQEDTASSRSFRALDCERLPVDDFYTMVEFAVETSGMAWDLSNVEFDPPDGVKDGVPGWPFEALFAAGRSWPLTHFRRKKITVTARWGWAAVPAGIVEATLDVASVMSLGMGVGAGAEPGIVTSQTVEGFSESYQIPGFGNGGMTVGGMRVPKSLTKALPYRRKRWGVG